MSEDKLATAMSRGAQAEALLRSDLLQERFSTLEHDYIEAWKTSPARDNEGREKLFLAINVVGKVRDHLGRVAADGRLAQRNLDELVAAQKQKK